MARLYSAVGQNPVLDLMWSSGLVVWNISVAHYKNKKK